MLTGAARLGAAQPMRELSQAGGFIDDPLSPYRSIDRPPRDGHGWVMANMVAGLDGTAAIEGRVGSLSTPRDFELFRRLRGLADVVLVGAATVRQERYGPVSLDDDLVAHRQQSGRGVPRVAIVSSSLDLDPELPIFTQARPGEPPIVLTTSTSDTSHLAALPVEIVVAGEHRVDLRRALAELARCAPGVILCEGGPSLLGEIIAADLLDEYCLTISPVVGGDPLPVINSASITDPVRFALHHVYTEDSTLFLNYLRVPQT
jgi:riboflavin biosynthesis pyrimidine reductase